MILTREELALIKRGRPWFTVPLDPKWEQGRVVRLRASGKDQGFPITVEAVAEVPQGFRVFFTPGDSREEVLYLSAGWPDYTSDPFRSMRDELPPMPEDMEERKARMAWLALALRDVGAAKRYRMKREVVSSTRRERVVYSAGSPEALEALRRWTERVRNVR